MPARLAAQRFLNTKHAKTTKIKDERVGVVHFTVALRDEAVVKEEFVFAHLRLQIRGR